MAVYKDENKTKDGRSWYFKTYKKDFNGNNKAYKSKKYLRKTDAEEAERIFLMKRDNPLHKPFSIIADDYFDNLSKIRKDSTVYSYKKDFNGHIKPFFEKYDILDINVQIIKIWASELEKKGISVSYMNKIHNILNCIFDFGIKNYGLNENPSRVFGTFQEKNDKITLDELKLRYITLNDFNIFINNIHDPLWNTFFNFAFYTGCRKGEIQALTWKDIDLNNNEIIINKTLYEEIKGKVVITSTKNNKNRKIKINKTLNDVLQKYKTYVKQFSDYSESWYVFGNTRFLPKTTIDRYKHNFFVECGLKDKEITMHEFRHSHVSLLINEYVKASKEKNMKIDTAKFFLMMSNRMGHTIQVMQETYMHLFPTIQDEIVDLLDNL